MLLEPVFGLVVQGAKQMVQGELACVLDSARYLVTSLDLPARTQVTEASPGQPYLGVALKLDLHLLTEVMLKLPPRPPVQSAPQGLMAGDVTPPLVEAVARLVALLDDPPSLPILAPLVEQELYYRLLVGREGEQLRQLVSVGTRGHRMATAVKYLTTHYRSPFQLEALLELVSLSPATFYRHFRQFTGMSPLQFQKWLRLNAARRLMLTEGVSAATAAFRVGYESSSQFSREYRRAFGTSPAQDVAAVKRQSSRALYVQDPF
ncbi:AraC family transcriptional regulator [Deinococcus metallilatus]|uniref:AraC family transcriptional regulator n=1 Tax=Deinococcus metallilatus TaxID=1211322 RepID=UPI001FCF965D|nr:AraC family transcriptional regulator [Deinococcus metallilatus]